MDKDKPPSLSKVGVTVLSKVGVTVLSKVGVTVLTLQRPPAGDFNVTLDSSIESPRGDHMQK